MSAAGFISLVSSCLLQIAIPMRHWLYAGDVVWNEDGHMYSWRMKLRSKDGYVGFRVRYANGDERIVHPARFLTPRQWRKIASRPDLILSAAHFIGRRVAEVQGESVAVFADVFLLVNGRAAQRYVTPDADLMNESMSFLGTDWLMPYDDKAPYLAVDEYFAQGSNVNLEPN